MAGGESEQPDMTTIINQFNQTMTSSQSQIQHLQEVIQQLANGANIQNQSNQQIVIDINNIREQLQRQLSDGYAEPPPLFNLLITLPLHSTSDFPPLPPSRAILLNYDLFNYVYVNILMAAQHATTTTPLASSTLVRPSQGQPGSGTKG